jgi:putative FmdB family regulatory protein
MGRPAPRGGLSVPLYDFHCLSCDERFEEFASPGERAPCPACGSSDVERVYQAFAGPFTIAPRGAAARRSNAQRRVREELRSERMAERRAQRKEGGPTSS